MCPRRPPSSPPGRRQTSALLPVRRRRGLRRRRLHAHPKARPCRLLKARRWIDPRRKLPHRAIRTRTSRLVKVRLRRQRSSEGLMGRAAAPVSRSARKPPRLARAGPIAPVQRSASLRRIGSPRELFPGGRRTRVVRRDRIGPPRRHRSASLIAPLAGLVGPAAGTTRLALQACRRCPTGPHPPCRAFRRLRVAAARPLQPPRRGRDRRAPRPLRPSSIVRRARPALHSGPALLRPPPIRDWSSFPR